MHADFVIVTLGDKPDFLFCFAFKRKQPFQTERETDTQQ